MKILKQEVEFYLQASCVVWRFMHKLCVGEISEKPSRKLETWLPPFYKTMNYINIVFSNYLQKRYLYFTLDDVLIWKVTISASLKKINFRNNYNTDDHTLHLRIPSMSFKLGWRDQLLADSERNLG